METIQFNREKLYQLFFDARFWIVLLFLLRLEGIDNPPVDEHSYRQGLTLGVARNFLEIDWNIFQPRTMFCDSRPGYEVMEFPLYNYGVFLMWKVFGEHNWCFRLLGLIVASLGLWYFYKIAQRLTTRQAALASMVLLGTSITFIYARKAMPDVFSLFLTIIGVSFGWDYLEKGKKRHLILFMAALAGGLLSKIPSIVAVVFLAIPFLDPTVDLSRKIKLGVAGLVPLALMSGWYFVWIPWAEKAYHHGFYFRLGWSEAWAQITSDEVWPYTKERFYPIALQSKLAYWFLLAGLGWMVYQKNYRLVGLLLLYSAIFFLFILQVGRTFSAHEYYIIPYVPIMALLAGYGLASLVQKPWLFLLLLGVSAGEAVWRKKSDFVLKWQEKRMLKLERIVDQTIPKHAKILVVNHPVHLPSMMYLAHRRGWAEGNLERALDTAWINGEATVGMDYIITDRTKVFQKLPYPMLFEDNEFRIFKTTKE